MHEFFGPTRYRGLARTHLQQLLTATAMNMVRVIAWLWGEPVGERQRKLRRFAQLVPPTESVVARFEELPIWLTPSSTMNTFRSARFGDANVLTHIITQDIYTLKDKISVYRRARVAKGLDPLKGIVSPMLHTFLVHVQAPGCLRYSIWAQPKYSQTRVMISAAVA
jgi:hypothetical protein